MRKVITKDGSITYYNEEFKDYYHSQSGAVEEAEIKHVGALKIKPKKVIFDICFGLGYNAAAALDKGPATVYCFENDKEILKKILDNKASFKSYNIIKEFIKNFFEGKEIYETKDSKLIMLFGDAKKNIKEVIVKADYVFFDPFSPAKVPEMWSKEFFKDIYDKMDKGAKLSTYSCARFVRDNMRKAGFKVIDGPVIGRNSPSTICIKDKT